MIFVRIWCILSKNFSMSESIRKSSDACAFVMIIYEIISEKNLLLNTIASFKLFFYLMNVKEQKFVTI